MESIISLSNFCGGALQEKFNEAAAQVMGNLQDPNTPWKNKREICVKISFSQNEDRDDMAVDVSVTTKLAPVTPIETRMAIGKDIRTGKVYAEEYGKQIKGRMSFADVQPQPEKVVVGDDVVDADTGEVTGKVMDFRKAQEA